jgi:hypothetical protein
LNFLIVLNFPKFCPATLTKRSLHTSLFAPPTLTSQAFIAIIQLLLLKAQKCLFSFHKWKTIFLTQIFVEIIKIRKIEIKCCWSWFFYCDFISKIIWSMKIATLSALFVFKIYLWQFWRYGVRRVKDGVWILTPIDP